MSRWLKRSLIAATVIISLMLLSMLIVPWQLKKQSRVWIADNTERTLAIEKAFFNPFTLTLELKGINLSEPDSEIPFVSCSRLMVSASLRSIIDRALILRRIELDHPYVKIDMLGQHAFNFSDFMHLGGDAAPDKSDVATQETKPFLFSFNNIVIVDGEVDFNDHASPQSSHHEIRQLALSVPVIGNVSYLADEYVTPKLELLLNGATIEAQGQAKPFDNSQETELALDLFDTDIAFYAQNSPVPLPFDLQRGTLDGEIDLNYQMTAAALPKLIISGDFVLSDLAVFEPDGSPLFSMDTLLVDLDKADLFKQTVTLSAIELYEPQLALKRNRQGQLNLASLFVDSQKKQPIAPDSSLDEEPESGQLPLVLVKKLQIHDGQLFFSDQMPKTEQRERIHDLQLKVENLSTYPDQLATVNLDMDTDRHVVVSVAGSMGVVPPQAQIEFSAKGLELEPYYPYLEQMLTAPLSGQIDLSGHVSYADGDTLISDGAVTVRDLLVPFSGEDHFGLSRLQIQQTSVDVSHQRIDLGQLRLSGGEVSATRLADGSLSPLKLLRPVTDSSSGKTENEQSASAPWSLNVGTFDLEQFKVQLRDETATKKPALTIKKLGLHAEKISYPEAQKSPFRLTAKMGKKGDVRVEGTVVHTPLQLNAKSRISALALADFNDFMPDNLQLKIKDGQLFSTLAVRVKQQQDNFQGTFSGDLALRRFDLHALQGGQLLSWEGMNIAGIKGDIAPFAVQVKGVALNDYRANIEIAPDGRVNLTTVAASDDKATGGEEPAAVETVPLTEETQETSPARDIRIDAVTLQGGTVSFTDRHLPSTFATTMYNLGGRISGLSSDEEMQADVDLRGQLENNSPLTISGKINPLSNDLFADLTISFKDIDLYPMTPYSGTYLGYAIDKGKLYLDLNYHIEHQEIRADNKVLIDQFTLGDTIDSEDATSLPVAMAISLLKDRNEEIHLDIPISGNLNDPDFSLAGTIFSVLRNLLIKAATSPFALLSSMVGGGEDVSSISFALGSAEITPDQTHKLANLVQILDNRPSLILEISAFADKENDPEAYRHSQLTAMVQAEKWSRLSDEKRRNTTLQQLTVSTEEYATLLKRVYKDAQFPRPRNMIGLLKSLPTAEMEKLLLANIPAGEEEMIALAKARAMAVRDNLVALDEELKPRLFLMNSDIYTPPKEGTASRVEFGINAK